MPGYKHPCKYCDKLVPEDANVCPYCGKKNPVGSFRCPKCRNPIQKDYVACSNCGVSLKINCPNCGKPTFFGEYCDQCNQELVVICKKCKTVQPPISETCIKCKKPLK
ncbi:MAG: zinc ribbon domain-containing protein [bacterium]